MRVLVIWFAIVISITTMTLWAFNVDYHAHPYVLIAVSYAVMIWHDWPNKRRVLLNGLYWLTALIAIIRWQ